ncbi:hypothetical protein IWQ60_009651 [Tieghemiomyces parasiticus]|uniref:Fungal lipase-type domain-containing protein n=1 Tax=Tieghemiomyces parasiticus TaxID=78921 RepID=A0A9W8DP03_9FUNG|nr:hypothetical protein IWQ60_009651 [Tieghemiomyces parasiticus]
MASYDDVSTWTCEDCTGGTVGTQFVTQYDDPIKGVHWYLAVHPSNRTIILSFEGSNVQSIVTYIQDIRFKQVAWPPGVDGSAVHNGFLDSMTASAAQAMAALQQQIAKTPEYRISITGHSLGAAQAVLFVTYLATHQPAWLSRTTVYTYGQPRVGNAAFAVYYQGLGVPTTRVVNKNDIVTRLAPRWTHYAQQGNEVWIRPSDGSVVACAAVVPAENPNCSAGQSVIDLRITDHLQYFAAHS